MHLSGWVGSVLSSFIGTWLIFDGTRAILLGSYVTPSSGRFAGQLGPWSHLIKAFGLDPMSMPVKLLHIITGIALLVAVAMLWSVPALGWWFMLGACILGMWYLPWGTVFLAIAIVLLLTPSMRAYKQQTTGTKSVRGMESLK